MQIEIRRKALGSVAPIVETLGPEATDVHLLPVSLHNRLHAYMRYLRAVHICVHIRALFCFLAVT